MKKDNIEERLKFYEESPYESSYKAVKGLIEKYNGQIASGQVDLFDKEDKPKFEMLHKYITELDFYLSTLDKIRAKMNPEIANKIDKEAKDAKLKEKDKSIAL